MLNVEGMHSVDFIKKLEQHAAQVPALRERNSSSILVRLWRILRFSSVRFCGWLLKILSFEPLFYRLAIRVPPNARKDRAVVLNRVCIINDMFSDRYWSSKPI